MSLPAAASAASFSNDDGIVISDGGCGFESAVQAQATPYPSTISVSGLAGQVVTDVNVTLSGFTHTFPADVRVLLVGPEGETVLLLHKNGSAADVSNLDVGFDDAAAQSPPTASALTGGPYKPSDQSEGGSGCIPNTATDSFPAPAPAAGGGYGSALSDFNGTDPNGDWDLYVVDAQSSDTGSLAGWSLEITTAFVNDDGIAINDGTCSGSGQAQAAPYPSTIAVSGLAGQVVTDVNVTLSGFTHGDPTDVRVLLVGPAGQRVLLLHENGHFNNVSNLDVGFDDAAAQSPPTDESALTGGPYKPSNQAEGQGGCGYVSATSSFPGSAPGGGYGSALSGFNGTDPNGDWKLYVVDDFRDNVGSLAGWRLEITTEAANAAPVAVDDAYTHNGSDTALSVAAAGGVLANDTDADGDALTAAKVTDPSNGTVTAFGSDGSFTYQPNENFVGTDSFTYKANDGEDDSNAATVTITVGAGCNGLQATITGTSGANKLTGTAGADVIAGLGGNDTILAGGGNDTVCGGSGNDTTNLDTGNDRADGGSGNDAARGDAGDDTLLGAAGADSLLGGAGNDTLSGGAGSPDSCKGDAGTDTLPAGHGCEQTSGVP